MKLCKKKGEFTSALSFNLCTDQPLTESDDTRCCINIIYPPDDEHIVLETCGGIYYIK
jgi:hypothetical protein